VSTNAGQDNALAEVCDNMDDVKRKISFEPKDVDPSDYLSYSSDEGIFDKGSSPNKFVPQQLPTTQGSYTKIETT
jgi:hypothetical protein